MHNFNNELANYNDLDWLAIKGKLSVNHFLISEKIISDFLIPDNISPNKFTNNYKVAKLSMGGLLIKVNSVLTPFKMEITESLNFFIYEKICDRPLGLPTWFISCYPDIVHWMNSNQELVSSSSPFSEFDATCCDRQQYLKPIYLRQIVNFYIANARTPLECKMDKYEEHKIKTKKNKKVLLKQEDEKRIFKRKRKLVAFEAKKLNNSGRVYWDWEHLITYVLVTFTSIFGGWLLYHLIYQILYR